MKIAIHGPMCSGKTTIANIIKKYNHNFITLSFGGKIKDIAKELFNMKNKDRSLLISIASKLREIDEDVWVKYVIKQTSSLENCIVDDLRFQNELNYLDDWIIISLTTPKDIRIQRIKQLYPENFEDHIKNMNHISENDNLKLPKNTQFIDTNIDHQLLEEKIIDILRSN